MKSSLFCSLLFLIVFYSACSSEEGVMNCDKLKSTEEALDLGEEIRENKIESLSEIRENIKGDWGTIGVIPGWVAFDVASQCIRLAVGDDSITLTDVYAGISSTSAYDLVEKERLVDGEIIIDYVLEVDDAVYHSAMSITEFSQNQMCGNMDIIDSDIYFYERID